jgi:hypothetical protein
MGGRHSRGSGELAENCLSEVCWEVIADLFEVALMSGGACSWARVTDGEGEAEVLKPREPGEPLLPMERVDTVYQYVDNNNEAMDMRAEVGYGDGWRPCRFHSTSRARSSG